MTSLFSGMSVQFTDTSIYPETWQWNFGDGASLTFQNPTHLYENTTSAVFPVQEIVTNVLGSGTALGTIYVGIAPSNLTTSPIVGHPYGNRLSWQDNSNNEIGFQLYSKMAPDPNSLAGNSFSFTTTVLQNQTTFDDYGSNTAVGLDSTLLYAYEVRAITSDTVSAFSSYGPPFAAAQFYSFPSSGYITFGLMTVQVGDLSSNATTWYWDFGDGNTFTGQNPGSHVYNSTTCAVFYVTESVNNGLGFGSVLGKAIFLNVPPSNLSATTTGDPQVFVSWQNNSLYETGNEVYQQINGGVFSLHTSLPPHTSSFIDTNLLPNTNYGYEARSTTYTAVSNFTNVATVNTGITSGIDRHYWFYYSGNQSLDEDVLDQPKTFLESYHRK